MMSELHGISWSLFVEERAFPALSLCNDQFDLWLAPIHDLQPSAIRDRLKPVLSTDERQRAARLRRGAECLGYIIARALVRLILSQYAPIDPRDWRFSRDSHGRPRVAMPELSANIHFSLSHSDGLAACLVSTREQAAVDAEKIQDAPDLRALADHVLHPMEIAVLDRLPAGGRAIMFFDLWTLKEAYAKARGLGFSLPFRDIAVEFAADGIPRLRLFNDIHDDPAAWGLWIERMPSGHVVSIAARGTPAEWRGRIRPSVRVLELSAGLSLGARMPDHRGSEALSLH